MPPGVPGGVCALGVWGYTAHQTHDRFSDHLSISPQGGGGGGTLWVDLMIQCFI